MTGVIIDHMICDSKNRGSIQSRAREDPAVFQGKKFYTLMSFIVLNVLVQYVETVLLVIKLNAVTIALEI